MITRIPLALGAGFIGSLANVAAVWIIASLAGDFIFNKTFVYKQVFWGGAWALLYCLPFIKQWFILRGLLVSVLASVFTFFIFQTIPLNNETIIRAFVVNVVAWGMVSSYIYHKGTTSQKS